MRKRVVKTVCQMCYHYCGIDVTVENGRIVKVEGTVEHPVNGGRLCAKGISCQQLVIDPKRLKTPLRRVGERGSRKWERISWDEALDEMAEKLLSIRTRYGPEYVAYYRGQAPGWDTHFNYVWRFMNSWGSPNLMVHSHLCFVPRAIAHGATFGPFPEPDYENTKCMVLIGYNPVSASAVNYAARIISAKQRGAKLIVIDPRFTNTAAKADIFLQPRPGTTGALVLAMVQVIIEEGLYNADFVAEWTTGFDRLKEFIGEYTPEKVEPVTWVKADKVRQAARLVGTTKPAVVVDGNGLDQHTNTVQTVRTTSILRSLIRSVDEAGGSVMVPPLPFIDVQRRGSQPADFYKKSVCRYPLFAQGGFGLTGVEMVDSLLTEKPYRLRAIIVQGGDPVASLSNSKKTKDALKKTDFLVVHDLYETATAEFADLVLPAASFLERDLIMYYRYRPFADGNLIAMQNQCIVPVGESRSDLDLIFSLAQSVGLEKYFPWEKVEDAFDWELEPNGITVSWLREHPGGYVVRYRPEEVYRKYEKNGFPTPSKKIELVASRLEKNGFDALPNFLEPGLSPISQPRLAEKYPLICATGLKLGIHTHTQFRTLPWIREIEPEPFGEIHPQTAAEYGIEDNKWMSVKSPEGSIKVRARIQQTVQPGVISLSYGYGEPYAGREDLTNVITGDEERDPITGTTGNRSFLCKVERAEG